MDSRSPGYWRPREVRVVFGLQEDWCASRSSRSVEQIQRWAPGSEAEAGVACLPQPFRHARVRIVGTYARTSRCSTTCSPYGFAVAPADDVPGCVDAGQTSAPGSLLAACPGNAGAFRS